MQTLGQAGYMVHSFLEDPMFQVYLPTFTMNINWVFAGLGGALLLSLCTTGNQEPSCNVYPTVFVSYFFTCGNTSVIQIQISLMGFWGVWQFYQVYGPKRLRGKIVVL